MANLSPSGKEALDKLIKEATDGQKPGFVFGVSNLDGEIYFQGSGSNVVGDPSSGAVNPDSVFWLCSQTKMIAALAALKLLDLGKVTLDTLLSDHFPEFRNPIILDDASAEKPTFRPAKTPITLKHLLNFTSGLFYPEMPNNGLPKPYTSKAVHATQDPVSEFFRLITGDLPGLPLKFEPGTSFAYGWSSDVLGFLVEKISGQTLEEFCKEHIFNPLGMQTSFYLTPELKKKLVSLNFRDTNGVLHPWNNQMEIIEQDPSKVKLHFGGAAMYSSMRDYLKLLRHLLQINAGRTVENPILKKETVQNMFIPTLPDAGVQVLSQILMTEGLQWGTTQALITQDQPGRRKKGSATWGGWAGTSHFLDPTTGIAVVFGIQVCPPPDMQAIALSMQLETTLYSSFE